MNMRLFKFAKNYRDLENKVKKIIHIILILLFSLTVFSCAKKEEEKEAPVLTEVYPVTTPTDDPSPNYTFSSTKAGTITYGGSCSSGTTSATKVLFPEVTPLSISVVGEVTEVHEFPEFPTDTDVHVEPFDELRMVPS